MKIAIYFTISAICLWPLGASANWQYTKWGMTPAQVQKASKNLAMPIAGQSTGEKAFDVYLGPFDIGPSSNPKEIENPAHVPLDQTHTYVAEVKQGKMCLYGDSPEVKSEGACSKTFMDGVSVHAYVDGQYPLISTRSCN
jgi:hypothetical protein